MFESLSTMYYAYVTLHGIISVSRTINTISSISNLFTKSEKRFKDMKILTICVDDKVDDCEALIIDQI